MFGFLKPKKKFSETAEELCSVYNTHLEQGSSPRKAIISTLAHVKENYKTSSIFTANNAYIENVFDAFIFEEELASLDKSKDDAREMVRRILLNTIQYELHRECITTNRSPLEVLDESHPGVMLEKIIEKNI